MMEGMDTAQSRIDEFQKHRDRLFALAYRMLGLRSNTEDILQEASMQWMQLDGDEIRSPGRYLTRVVTNLCLDELRSARRRREEYVGAWLPEPIETGPAGSPAYQAELADSLSIAFLRLLETLSPPERAVFLLREIFRLDYDEIAETIEMSEANCRQLAHRARRRLQDGGKPRFDTSIEERDRLMSRFLQAVGGGDLEGLKETLAADITMVADGGGRAPVARRPLLGLDEIARFIHTVGRKFPQQFGNHRLTTVNGEPALIFYEEKRVSFVWSFHIEGGRIRNIFVIANPEKLEGIVVEI